MKLSKTTLGIPLAGLLLVGAAGAVLATSGGPGSPAGSAPVVPAAPSASPSPSTGTTTLPARETALTAVLDDLVAKGTITATQKTAILDALAAERTARQAERQQLRQFLADGVITQDEFNQLPADSPLRTAAGLMDDGKITVDELRSIARGILGGGGFRGGHGGMMGGGPGWFGKGGPAPSATPAPTSGTSG